MASQNMRIGLISFGIVFGVGIVIGSIVLIASSSKGSGRNPASNLFPGNTSVSSNNDLEQIQNHKWWSRPLKESEAQMMIDKMVSANRDSFFWARHDGKMVLQPPGSQHGQPDFILAPEEMKNAKRLYIHIVGQQRYTEAEAISALLAKLNNVEFRDGPGRK